MKYVILSLFTLMLGIVFLILAVLARRKIIKGRLYHMLPYILLLTYITIQMIFLYFNMGSTGSMNSYIIALLLAAFFIVMPPVRCLLIIGLSFLSAIIMLVILMDNEIVFSATMMTDTWANTIIITGLSAYFAVLLNILFIRNVIGRFVTEEQNRELARVARTDSLTGVYNRRGFYEVAETLLDSRASEGYLAAAMCDIDFFKKYNDRNGHLEGDACLMKVARTLKSCLDNTKGVVCRYGGEEFLAYFMTDSPEEAERVVELCRKKVEERNMTGFRSTEDSVGPITISVGLAYRRIKESDRQVPVDGTLIKAADDALYRAKAEGRNRVVKA